MRAWTIQTPDVLAVLRSGQTWRARACNVPHDWTRAYQWMSGEMRARLGQPANAWQSPIWVWCQWRGATRAQPDLRARGHLPTGTCGVRIELDLDDARLLLSDFELWHYVLNGWYLPTSLADEGPFNARPDRRRIAASWKRVFDLDWLNRRNTAARSASSIQGVTWELRPGDVRGATTFTAR
ncbi:MAG: DUF3841 domain-containing protein [Steroidobacteraceae bacterium]|jgi:hypothetical protein|nr:DUF3841 domain-containing protein [Pseudomonadota bacterium]MBP6106898.1 DUF3841 domain-containing protein [Steroidobacteraceae bacterium]MBP7015170.1 DUF3841 domain-containing protein [Steroidobacteraceae bacterium]